MNAAAKLSNQGVMSRGVTLTVLLSRTQVLMMVLILTLLTSALSVVYVTNATRSLSASYQQKLAERDRLHVEYGQLLLEKSTWMVQSRVQQIAEKKFGMVIPDSKSILIISSK